MNSQNQQNLYSMASSSTDALSSAGKLYGTIVNGGCIMLAAVILVILVYNYISSSKYQQSNGTVVQVLSCSTTTTYNSKNQPTTIYTCNTIIKYMAPLPANSSQIPISTPAATSNNQQTNQPSISLGYNPVDKNFYQEFVLSQQYSVGSALTVYYDPTDPFGTASMSLFPNVLYYILMFICVAVIIGCSFWIWVLFNYKAASTVEGVKGLYNMF